MPVGLEIDSGGGRGVELGLLVLAVGVPAAGDGGYEGDVGAVEEGGGGEGGGCGPFVGCWVVWGGG